MDSVTSGNLGEQGNKIMLLVGRLLLIGAILCYIEHSKIRKLIKRIYFAY